MPLAKFEQNGQPKERSNSASKMGSQFCQKKQNGQRMSFEFLDCMSLATIPAILLLDLLLPLPIYFVSYVGGFIKEKSVSVHVLRLILLSDGRGN